MDYYVSLLETELKSSPSSENCLVQVAQKDVEDILIDDLLEKLKKKTYFKSSIIDREGQTYLINKIDQIINYKGNLTDSDICFIKKKIN